MSDFKIVEEMEITGALGSRPIPQLVEIVYEVTRGTVKVQSVWGWSGEYFEVPIGRDEYDTVKAHQLAASDWAARCESTQSWFEDMAAERDRKIVAILKAVR